jgi:hypothetical protein
MQKCKDGMKAFCFVFAHLLTNIASRLYRKIQLCWLKKNFQIILAEAEHFFPVNLKFVA